MAFESVQIQSTRNGTSLVVGFRQDVAAADVLLFSLTSTVGVTSVRWELVGRPRGSVAGGAGPEPVSLGTGLSASFTADSDAGAFKLDGSYKVQAVLNPGAPSETRKTVVVARTSGLTVPAPGGGSMALRKLAGFEALEDTSIGSILQGWATQLNGWLSLVQQLSVGGGLTETLSGAYNSGASSADQTLGLADARGGGLVVDGSGGGYTGTSALRVATSANAMSLAVIRATGRVGIGTTAPARDLQISSTAPAIRLDDTNGVVFDVSNDASALTISAPGGPTTVAVFPSTGGMRADLGVGIGAAAPTAAALAMGAGSGAAVSSANTGRLRYNESTQHFEISENGGAYTMLSTGGGGGAPVGAQYLTLATDGTLTSERVFTPGNRIAVVDGGAGGTYSVSVILSAGISGGDILSGGSGPGESLILVSTNNATKGGIFFGTSTYDDVNQRLGLGTFAPAVALVVAGVLSQAAAEFHDGETTPVSVASTGRLRYDAVSQHFQISENAGPWTQISAGATAPTDAQYLTLALNSSLSQERVFTPGNRLSAADGGANGNYTLSTVLSAGISGGDTLAGGTAASEALTLTSTANATKGKLLFGTSAYDEANNRLGIGTTTPSVVMDLTGSTLRTAVALTGGSSVAVSGASAGRLRYNESTNHFEISENTGAYVQVGTPYRGTAAGAVLFTGATPFPITEDDTRFFYETVTVGPTPEPRLYLGINSTLNNTLNLGPGLHIYSAGSAAGHIPYIRLQNIGQPEAAIDFFFRARGAVSPAEIKLAEIISGKFSNESGFLQLSTAYQGSAGVSVAANFAGGGVALFGPLFLGDNVNVGATPGTDDFRNCPIIHFGPGTHEPNLSFQDRGRLYYSDVASATLPSGHLLFSNSNTAFRPVQSLGRGTTLAAASQLNIDYAGDFYEITGTTAIDFIRYTNGAWGGMQVADMEPITLHFASATPVNHNTGSVPGSFRPILLAGGASTTFPAGTFLQLRHNKTLAAWVEQSHFPSSGSDISGFTSGSVIFASSTGTLAQDNANFFWSSTNHRLGIGTTSPVAPLTIARSDTISGNGVAVYLNQASGQGIFKNGGVFSLGTDDANFMSVLTNNAIRIRIESSGAMSFTLTGEPASGATMFHVRNTVTVASGSGAVLNSTRWANAAVTITGSTNIATAAGFNMFSIEQPAFSGTVTIAQAGTFVIVGAPTITGGGAITNPYALWVQAGTSRFDGIILAPEIHTTVLVTGDLDLGVSGSEGEWTLREGPDCLRARNKRTGRWYRLALEEDREYAGA